MAFSAQTVVKWISNSVTEPDNATVCPVRLMAIAGVLQYMALAAFNFIKHGAFDAQAYAIGFSALLGGIGVALGLKKDSPSA